MDAGQQKGWRAATAAAVMAVAMVAMPVAAQKPPNPELDQKYIEMFNKAEFTEAWKLVQRGADPDAPLMPGGRTPLEHAGMNGMLKHLAFLSSVDAKSLDSALIMTVSRYSGSSVPRHEVADRLLKMGANPQAVDKYARSVLYWAARAGDDNIVQKLIERGGIPDLYSKLMMCPAVDLSSAARRFLAPLDLTCQCPAGSSTRMSRQGSRFTRWCEAGGRRVGMEVDGVLDATPPTGLWGDWHPREVIAARLHDPAGTVELYRCTNLSCMSVTR